MEEFRRVEEHQSGWARVFQAEDGGEEEWAHVPEVGEGRQDEWWLDG